MNASNESQQRLRTALITGASSGIGLELAREFARNGHNLILVARGADQLAQVATMLQTEFDIEVQHLQADLTQPADIERLFAETEGQGLEVDILVNNAGEGAFGKFHEIPFERLAYLIQLNVLAVTQLTHLFLPRMLQRGRGHVLNTASIASFEPGPLLQVYHATKSYVLLLTEALAWEYEDTGVRFTALAPGATDTDFFVKADMEESPMSAKEDLADPEDVAKHAYERMMAGDVVTVHKLKNKMYASLYRFLPRQAVTAMMGRMYKPEGDDNRDGHSEEHGFVDRNAGEKPGERQLGSEGTFQGNDYPERRNPYGSDESDDIRRETSADLGALGNTTGRSSVRSSGTLGHGEPADESGLGSGASSDLHREGSQDSNHSDEPQRGYESIRQMSYGTESAAGTMSGQSSREADRQSPQEAREEGDRLNDAFGASRGSSGTATGFGGTGNPRLTEEATQNQDRDRVYRDNDDTRDPLADDEDQRHRTGTDRPGQGI